jgi:hydrogenase/urease accessory protein HupE
MGLMMANLLPGLPFFETLNVASFVILGLLVALELELDKTLFLSLVVLFGLSHGYANGAPDFRGVNWGLYVAGVALAAYLLITLVSCFARALTVDRTWGSIAVRAAGSWIAAAGAMYGGFLLTVS